MRLRIISDGTPQGTRVLDGNGRMIKGIASVTWNVDASGRAKATLTFNNVAVDVIGHEESEENVVVCPLCGHMAVLPVKQIGKKEHYTGSEEMFTCGVCKKKSYAEDWFDYTEMD